MIEGQCSVCRRVFKVDDRYAGMTGRCKACGATIRIPGELDEGLDGLPSASAAPGAAAAAEGEPPASQAAPAATAPVPAPAAVQPLGPLPPHPADELTRPHDTRARYEPSEGPTPMKGSWVREEEPAGAPRPAAAAAEERSAPAPARSALADRFITPAEGKPAAATHRPKFVSFTGVILGLLALGLAAHVATAGIWGQVAAGLGIALAGLAIVRLWTAHWDGFLAGLLLCACAAGSALLPSEVEMARRILAGASGLALLLLLLGVLRRTCREYFTT